MHPNDFIEHLESEGCYLDPDLSTEEVNIILHPYCDSKFISLPKIIPDLTWFEIIRFCTYLEVKVPPECEDFREVYHAFLADLSKRGKPWDKK